LCGGGAGLGGGVVEAGRAANRRLYAQRLTTRAVLTPDSHTAAIPYAYPIPTYYDFR
jgi:hypothetical protein